MTPLNTKKTGYGSINRQESAQSAFSHKDVQASQDAHSLEKIRNEAHEEKHREWGDYLKASQFGGMDGIMCSFAIVTSAAGSGLSWMAVLAVGFGVVFASALSMGVGEFLSEKGNVEWIFAEKKREEWEMEHGRDAEIKEMVDIYMKKSGDKMPLKEAQEVIDTMAEYPEFFINQMMSHELNLTVPGDDWKMEAFKSGVVMFVSFIVFGSIPIVGYIILPLADPTIAAQHHSNTLLIFAVSVTCVALFFLGIIKSRYGTTPWWQNAMETMLLGAFCGMVAYSMGVAVTSLYSKPAN